MTMQHEALAPPEDEGGEGEGNLGPVLQRLLLLADRFGERLLQSISHAEPLLVQYATPMATMI